MLQEIYDSLEPDAADAEAQEESFVAPTSFAQRRFWLLDALSTGRATYNVPLGVLLHGPVRRAAGVPLPRPGRARGAAPPPRGGGAPPRDAAHRLRRGGGRAGAGDR